MSKKVENIVEESQELVKVDENDMVVSESVEVQNVHVVGDDGSQYIMAMNGERKVSYCSINQEELSFKEKAKFFNLINSEAEPIKDHVNESILLKDVYLEIVKVADMQTGEEKMLPRQVLIDNDGKAYTCSSPTFASKLASLCACAGRVDQWEEPIPIKFKEIKTTKGHRALTFETAF